MEDTQQIFIVSDRPIVQLGLSQLIDRHPQFTVCGTAASVRATWKLLPDAMPDLVVLDLTSDGFRGYDLMVNLKARPDGPAVLVLSEKVEAAYVTHAMRVGARGYLTYQDPPNVMLQALQQVLQGELYLSDHLELQSTQHIRERKPARTTAPITELSDREREVFQLLGWGLKTRDVAERLHLSPKTIDAHRQNMKRKLRLDTTAELDRLAIQWVHGRTTEPSLHFAN